MVVKPRERGSGVDGGDEERHLEPVEIHVSF
jgi:hypothetical protein